HGEGDHRAAPGADHGSKSECFPGGQGNQLESTPFDPEGASERPSASSDLSALRRERNLWRLCCADGHGKAERHHQYLDRDATVPDQECSALTSSTSTNRGRA